MMSANGHRRYQKDNVCVSFGLIFEQHLCLMWQLIFYTICLCSAPSHLPCNGVWHGNRAGSVVGTEKQLKAKSGVSAPQVGWGSASHVTALLHVPAALPAVHFPAKVAAHHPPYGPRQSFRHWHDAAVASAATQGVNLWIDLFLSVPVCLYRKRWGQRRDRGDCVRPLGLYKG